MPDPRSHTIRALLFDVDGTLIDTFHLYLEAYRRALAPFLGREPTLDDFIDRRPSSEQYFLREWIGDENAAACHEAMQRHYRELHPALCEGLYDGVREMLAALRSAGVPLGVVTGKGRGAWEVTDAALGLGRFEVVVTEDDVTQPKPHPGGLFAALEVMRVAPEQALYIGDSASDVKAGRLAGMQVAAVLWPKTGPGEREQFIESVREHEPDYLFERPADITRAFAAWC